MSYPILWDTAPYVLQDESGKPVGAHTPDTIRAALRGKREEIANVVAEAAEWSEGVLATSDRILALLGAGTGEP